MSIRYLSGINVDANTLFVDSANDRVGIGTATPSYKLDVNGVTRFQDIVRFTTNAWNLSDDSFSRLYFASSGRTYFGSGNGYEWRSDSDTALAVLTNAGNVGIGTTAPINKFAVITSNTFGYYNRTEAIAVFQGAQPTLLIANDGNNDNEYAELKLGNNQTSYYPYSAFVRGVQGAGIDYYRLEFGTANGVAATTKMTIRSNGNVLINTTTDAGYKLDVNGTSRSAGITLNGFATGTAGGNLELGFDGAHGVVQGYNRTSSTWLPLYLSGSDFRFNPSGTEFVRITSTGVGIGTTNPSQLLHVNGTSQLLGANFGIAGNNDFANYAIKGDAGGSVLIYNWYSGHIFQTNGGEERMRITNGGNVGIGTTSPGAKLDVNGEVYISPNTAGKNTFTFATNASNDGRLLIKSDTTTKVDIQANGASYFNGGNVGIGTTSPTDLLTIYATSQPILSLRDAGVNANYGGYIKGYGLSGAGGQINIGVIDNNTYRSGIEIAEQLATILFRTSASQVERMRITAAGNVGIGTTSPGAKLTIGDDTSNIAELRVLRSNALSSTYAYVKTNGGTSEFGGTGDARLRADGSSILSFYTNSSERMRITSDGSLLVGATSITYSNGALGYAAGFRGAVTSQAFIGIAKSNQTLGDQGMVVGLDGTTGYLWVRDNINLTLGTNNTTRVTILAAGNVGIGTTSPSSPFTVATDVRAASLNAADLRPQSQVNLLGGGGDSLFIGQLTNSFAYIQSSYFNTTLATYPILLNPLGGNILIGTTTDSGYKLRVVGSSYTTGDVVVAKTTTVNANFGGPVLSLGDSTSEVGMAGGIAFAENLTSAVANVTMGIYYDGKANKMHFTGSSDAQATAGENLIAATKHMTITRDTGLVGIGTTAPTAMFNVVNSGRALAVFRIQGTNRSTFYDNDFALNNDGGGADGFIYGSNSAGGSFPFNGYGEVIIQANPRTGYANGISFVTGTTSPTIKMRIVEGGNVLIGTTTDAGYKLRVNGEILADDDIRILNTFALVLNGTDNNWRIGRNTITDSGWLTSNTLQVVVFGSSSGQGFQVVNSNGTALFEIDGVAGASRFTNALGVGVNPSGTAGRIDASNDIVAYSSSDLRLKENIKPIENALDKVKALTGVEFDWKAEHKEAHGYEGHDTGVIAQEVQEVMPTAVRTNDTGYLAVRYEKLIGLLIEANKELAARVEELEKKLK